MKTLDWFNYFRRNVDLFLGFLFMIPILLGDYLFTGIASNLRVFFLLPFSLFFPGYFLYTSLFDTTVLIILHGPHSAPSFFPINKHYFIEQFSLSVILSLVILAIVSFALSFTHIGLVENSLRNTLLVIYFILWLCCLFARRNHSPYRTSEIQEYPSSRIPSVWLLLISSFVVIVVTVIFMQPKEKYTELYIVNRDERISAPSSAFPKGIISSPINLKIINHEGRDVQYKVIASTDMGNQVLSLENISINKDETVLISGVLNPIPDDASSLSIQLFFMESEFPYRSLFVHLE